jgi:DNA transposition AAA+ family ATPase
MTTILETTARRGNLGADVPETTDTRTEAAAGSAGQHRINIAVNLENWRHLPAETSECLMWFHQHLLDANIGFKEAGEAIDYDESTIYRVLRGTYEGNWANIVGGIRSYRRLVESRGSIQQNEFVETTWSKLIWAGLDYALANNSITVITGESRQGKTITAKSWKAANNHGRAVYVIAPTYGGPKALLAEIAEAVGVNRQMNVVAMHTAVCKAFNRHRMLIIDEAHRLLPGDRRTNPVMLEILRDLHDRTECGLALLATARFITELRRSEYMFEQLIGRIGMPVQLPRKAKEEDVGPILRQYVPRPSKGLMEICLDIANKPGRLGILVETLKLASRIAKKKGAKIGEDHVMAAVALRQQMQGETVFAK